MNKTRNKLTSLFIALLAIPLLLAIIFETGMAEEGILAGSHAMHEFAATAIMELLTIALIPAALRLFKLSRVEAQLRQHHEKALLKWGGIRLLMLGVPLLINTILYYVYMNTSFGYMAIIIVLCQPFVYPSRERCISEAFLTDHQEP